MLQTIPQAASIDLSAATLRDEDLVRVLDHIPDIQVELRYASTNNFLHQVLYDFQDAYLRYGTVKKLKAAQKAFREQGLSLKIWDAFRPVEVQFIFWNAMPDPDFVADPRKGFSNHSRGNAIDATLVDEHGQELPMPTCFDSFSPQARRDRPDLPEPGASNARLMQTIMEASGFLGYVGEWWHFDDKDRYDVEKTFTSR